MPLSPVTSGDAHVSAHNAERTLINDVETKVNNRIPIPNGPTVGSILRWNGENWVPSKLRLFEGNGSPEGVVSAPVGSRYVDASATDGVAEWFKASGVGNTGWAPQNTGLPWTNISLGTGFAHVAGNPGQTCMVDGTVFFQGAVRRTSGTGTVVGAVGSGMTPTKAINTFVRAGSAWIMAGIAVGGSITISSSLVSNQDIQLGTLAGTPYRRL